MINVTNEEDDQAKLNFSQFISFLINGSKDDFYSNSTSKILLHNVIYWGPYWKLCTPCRSDAMPSTIVKMDEGQFHQEVSLRSGGLMSTGCPTLKTFNLGIFYRPGQPNWEF